MERKVAALRNGTVIDHIPTDKVFKVVSILNLEQYQNQISIANHLESSKLGKKGLVKISDKILAENETNKIALIAPNAKINIIKDFEVVEKRPLSLPDEIVDVVQCSNPKCITNNQPIATRFFVLAEDGQVRLKCRYCEREISQEEARLK
jgi:aspartate carbamoyltransferase regulatory subunit